MKSVYFCSLCLAVGALIADLPVKEEIEQIQHKIVNSSSNEKAPFIVELAKAYLRDQEIELGVKAFIEALKCSPEPLVISVPSKEEQALYKQALGIYLRSDDQMENSKVVLEGYGKIVEENQDYYLLNYIVAASYANLGMLDRFFGRFYHSYSHLPNEYLAFKAQAVLHLLLFGKATSDEERALQKELVFGNALLGINQYPYDSALHKLALTYVSSERKKEMISQTLNQITEKNIVVPRCDVVFYIEEAMSVGNKELASKFLAKAQEWYTYSRVLQQAQDLLEGEGDHGRQATR